MSLKYIMPDWDDYVDADFDFNTDSFSTVTREGRRELYLHEIMGNEAPCDGILVSLAQLLKKKGALKNYNALNPITVRDIMRIPDKIKIIGDCGAFTYKDETTPPFTSANAANLYNTLGFNVGASVDHMMFGEKIVINKNGKEKKVPISIEDQRERMKVTRQNAKEFIEEVESKQYNFTPMGTIQGISKEDYADAFKYYIQLGYRSVALGSLVPKTDDEIKEIVLAVGAEYNKLDPQIKKEVKIHLFGVLRPKLFRYYDENGVTSFDSISFFRKAWLRSDNNYLGVNGEWYASLRVPQANLKTNSDKLKKKKIKINEAIQMEQNVLRLLSEYDNDRVSIEEVLRSVFEYDELFDRSFEDSEEIRKTYARTLRDKPWKRCNCPICGEIGIHVIIFRGTNRNKRRGFHNTIIFYDNLKNHNLEKILNPKSKEKRESACQM